MTDNCKNCTEIISGNFCNNCGQNSKVRRYSFEHFIKHDLIHGIWNIDNGIFYTIKELLTRPGHNIREFIDGKRVNYFSYVTLLLLILGISIFLEEYAQIKVSNLMPESSQEAINNLEDFTKNNPKFALLLTIPFYSIFSYIWFRKAKLNFAEHFVLNSYRAVIESLIGLLFLVLTIFLNNIQVLIIIYGLINLLILVYAFWLYKQFFSVFKYSNKSLIFRSLGVVFSYIIFTMFIGIIMGIIEHTN